MVGPGLAGDLVSKNKAESNKGYLTSSAGLHMHYIYVSITTHTEYMLHDFTGRQCPK